MKIWPVRSVGLPSGNLSLDCFRSTVHFGACKTCDGLGSNLEVDLDLVVPDWDLSLQKGAIAAWQPVSSQYYPQLLKSVCKHFGIDMKKPVKDLPKEHMDIVLNGSGDEKIKFRYKNEQGQVRENQIFFEGVLNNISRRYHESISSFTRELMGKYMAEHTARLVRVTVYPKKYCPSKSIISIFLKSLIFRLPIH